MVILPSALGAIEKVCYRPRGKWVNQGSDKEWQGGGGSSQTVMSPLIDFQEKFSWKNTFDAPS